MSYLRNLPISARLALLTATSFVLLLLLVGVGIINGMLARLDAAVTRERAFTADASHELRTPLAILRAELDLALRRVTDPPLRASIDSSLEEVDLLAELVDDLLLLARADADRHGPQPDRPR